MKGNSILVPFVGNTFIHFTHLLTFHNPTFRPSIIHPFRFYSILFFPMHASTFYCCKIYTQLYVVSDIATTPKLSLLFASYYFIQISFFPFTILTSLCIYCFLSFSYFHNKFDQSFLYFSAQIFKSSAF